MDKKYVIVIGDGMADFPLDELGGRTPLEAARKPAIDSLARNGILGRAWNVPAEMEPGSDVAIMSIMGYDPEKYFTGRGPLEAASIGIRVREGETAFRCNLISVEGGILRDYSAGHITTEEAGELIKSLNGELGAPGVRFHVGISYRHILMAEGDFKGVRCFPPHDHIGAPSEEFLPSGKGSETLIGLIRKSSRVLDFHPVNAKRTAEGKSPANLIWPWSGGAMPRFEGYGERFGMRGAVVSAVDLVRGLGRLAGLKPLVVEGATGLVDTNYEGKLLAALNALENEDLAIIHLEGCDEAGHMGDAALKVKGIEELDRRIVKPLLSALERYDDFKVLITPDHATPVPLRTHNRDPAPFIIYPGGGAENPSGLTYSEKNSGKTGVEYRRGHELIRSFFAG